MPHTHNSEEKTKPCPDCMGMGVHCSACTQEYEEAKEDTIGLMVRDFTSVEARGAKSAVRRRLEAWEAKIIRETERRTWEEAKNLAEYHLGWSPTGRTHDFHDGALKQTRMILKEIDARIAALTEEGKE